MTNISISLSNEQAERLRSIATVEGIALRRRVESLLNEPDDRFRKAAARVLEKNAEVYRRLS